MGYVCLNAHVEMIGQLGGEISLCHVGPGDQTVVIKLGGKCLCPLSHLAALVLFL